jgi:hypothetical protein
MDQDSSRFRGRKRGADYDSAAAGIALHAGLGDVFVFELDAEFFGGPFKAGEQIVAAFDGRVDKFGNWVAVGILLGEEPGDFEAEQLFDSGAVFVFGFPFLTVNAWRKDSDAFCAFLNVASESLPGSETGNTPSVGTLYENQNLIVM